MEAAMEQFETSSNPETAQEAINKILLTNGRSDSLEFDPYATIRSVLSPEHADMTADEITVALGRLPAALVLHQFLCSPSMRQATLVTLSGRAARRSVSFDGFDIPVPTYFRLLSRLCREVALRSETLQEAGGDSQSPQHPRESIARPWLFSERSRGGEPDALRDFESLFESEFRLDRLPPGAKAQFGKTESTAWREAVTKAIASGIRDAKVLADLIFFMQHRDRVAGGIGKLIEGTDPDFFRLRAEWDLYETIAERRLSPSAACSVFIPGNSNTDYEQYVNPPTTGRITLMMNGQTSGVPHTEAFDTMQREVESLGSGDSMFLSAFMLNPTLLTVSSAGLRTWGDLFVKKASQGVKIRIILTGIPKPGPPWTSNLDNLNSLVDQLRAPERDNLKYIVSMHPARLNFNFQFGLDAQNKPFLKSVENVPKGGVSLGVATHHQKFMVIRKNMSTIAFCGGLDISPQRTPEGWSSGFIWHDIHAMLEGRIAHDLEKEFVMRWNREKSGSTATLHSDWRPLENLTPTPADRRDQEANKNIQQLQMLRTVSVGATTAGVRRDDVWRGYIKLIGCARRFLFIENQYLHELGLAKAIVKQVEAEPNLIVMIVVSADTDDPENPFTEHGRAQQNECFQLLLAGVPFERRRVYSMRGRLVHSKLIIVDDRALSIGSTNADPRDFFMDTQLNVMLDDFEAVTRFRHALWSHDLGVSEAVVKSWEVNEFVEQWDEVAAQNEKLKLSSDKMPGEAVFSFDPTLVHGKRSRIADVLTELSDEATGQTSERISEDRYSI
jgi:phosphatidylserine/phosphatidylglycerophosphate/cardiolipin synthase-like enzyme